MKSFLPILALLAFVGCNNDMNASSDAPAADATTAEATATLDGVFYLLTASVPYAEFEEVFQSHDPYHAEWSDGEQKAYAQAGETQMAAAFFDVDPVKMGEFFASDVFQSTGVPVTESLEAYQLDRLPSDESGYNTTATTSQAGDAVADLFIVVDIATDYDSWKAVYDESAGPRAGAIPGSEWTSMKVSDTKAFIKATNVDLPSFIAFVGDPMFEQSAGAHVGAHHIYELTPMPTEQ
jgi:hypothetical protein